VLAQQTGRVASLSTGRQQVREAFMPIVLTRAGWLTRMYSPPILGLTSLLLVFPHAGKCRGGSCSACPDHAAGKEGHMAGHARENDWEKGKHVEEPEPQPTTACPTCGGLKEVWVECDACDGKGEGADRYTCGTCRGHGGWYQKCATCGGTGRISA
jgi:hypothetical protein